MKAVRWAAAAVTALMSLMNIPDRVRPATSASPTPVAWAATVVGVLGLVAAVGLLRRATWGRPAVLAVGAVNLVGAVVALANGWEGAAIGLVVSLLILGLGFLADREALPRPRPTAVAEELTARPASPPATAGGGRGPAGCSP